MSELTSIQFFKIDRKKIEQLVKILEEDAGGFVSQRIAVMMAVNKMIKEKSNGKKD